MAPHLQVDSLDDAAPEQVQQHALAQAQLRVCFELVAGEHERRL